MTDQVTSTVPETVQEKKSNPFAVALRAKAKTDPYKHDSYMATVLNAVADVVDEVDASQHE